MNTIYDFTALSNKGKEVNFADCQGKVLLIVNTASKCGFTPQYDGLESLYQKYKDQGLVIVGFPCDQFGHQEPGTDEQIEEFCRLNHGVTFPLMSKIEVNGDGALGLLNDVANAVGYACAYLLKLTGGDIFDEVVHDCSVLGLKFTDLSADSKNLCKVIGLHSLQT